MGAIGRALGRGLSAAANTAGDLLAKDYERGQELEANKTLAEHAAALQEKLELQKQKFTGDQNALDRDQRDKQWRGEQKVREDTLAQTGRYQSGQLQNEQTRLAETARHNKALEDAARSTASLAQDRLQWEKGKELDPATKATLSMIEGRMRGADAELAKLDPVAPDYAQRKAQIDNVRAALQAQFYATIGGKDGPPASAAGIPFDAEKGRSDAAKGGNKEGAKPDASGKGPEGSQKPGDKDKRGAQPAAPTPESGASPYEAGEPASGPLGRAVGAVVGALSVDASGRVESSERTVLRNLLALKSSGQLSARQKAELDRLLEKYPDVMGSGRIRK